MAEVDCHLRPASRVNAQEQDQISDLVSAALGPFLVEYEEEEEEGEQEQGLVPFPPGWISSVTDIRCVCCELVSDSNANEVFQLSRGLHKLANTELLFFSRGE